MSSMGTIRVPSNFGLARPDALPTRDRAPHSYEERVRWIQTGKKCRFRGLGAPSLFRRRYNFRPRGAPEPEGARKGLPHQCDD
jgi:hypothetical protein